MVGLFPVSSWQGVAVHVVHRCSAVIGFCGSHQRKPFPGFLNAVSDDLAAPRLFPRLIAMLRLNLTERGRHDIGGRFPSSHRPSLVRAPPRRFFLIQVRAPSQVRCALSATPPTPPLLNFLSVWERRCLAALDRPSRDRRSAAPLLWLPMFSFSS